MSNKRKTRRSSSFADPPLEPPPHSPVSSAVLEEEERISREAEAPKDSQDSHDSSRKSRVNPPSQADLSGSSAHPMFLGAVLSEKQMAAVKEFMNPPAQEKTPSFYGVAPGEACKKEFGAIISPNMLGAAESYAETNHPLYGEIGIHCAQRLPLSVMRNMRAGVG